MASVEKVVQAIKDKVAYEKESWRMGREGAEGDPQGASGAVAEGRQALMANAKEDDLQRQARELTEKTGKKHVVETVTTKTVVVVDIHYTRRRTF